MRPAALALAPLLLACAPSEASQPQVDAAFGRLFASYYRLCGVEGDPTTLASLTAFERRIARTRWAAHYRASKIRAAAQAHRVAAECHAPGDPDIVAQHAIDRNAVAAAIAVLDRLIAPEGT